MNKMVWEGFRPRYDTMSLFFG